MDTYAGTFAKWHRYIDKKVFQEIRTREYYMKASQVHDQFLKSYWRQVKYRNEKILL